MFVAKEGRMRALLKRERAEMAQWAYFLTAVNTFCTGQNILVDGGESINYHFVWKD